MIGTIMGFVGWMFAWIMSWLFFATAGFAAGWWVARTAAPASTAADAAQKGFSLIAGWLGKKQKAAEETEK
jgi:hypothetical protein